MQSIRAETIGREEQKVLQIPTRPLDLDDSRHAKPVVSGSAVTHLGFNEFAIVKRPNSPAYANR